jgi:DNA-binding NarL/FixJ family response regulator
MSLKIAVVDDHSLFRKGLINLIQAIDANFEVVLEAGNGKELLELLQPQNLPDLLILDLDMPIMDGHETTLALRKKYPDLGIIMLTMKNDEHSLIRMLRAGVNGYLNKDVEPEELKSAITAVHQNGYHYTDSLTGLLIQAVREPKEPEQTNLNEQEMKFLQYACSEYTYKEIADKMCLSEKTIDGYRARLFDKLGVKSRVGLAIHAIKNELIQI